MVAAVLGTFAAFVILFGFGMRNWTIVALGVALLVLAVSIVAVAALRGGARAWVTGMGHVHSVSEIPASSKFGRCEMQIVIDAPGLPPRSVKVRDPRVPVDKWPRPGAVLPIMVAIDDQRHVRILWDDVLTHAEADAEAEARMAAGGAPDYDTLADDVLIEQQAPPWTQRRSDEEFPLTDDDPSPADDAFLPPEEDLLASDPATTADRTDRPGDEPTVLGQAPGGGIVLEGTVVDPPAVVPLPRRATPGPGRRRPQPTPHGAHDTGTPAAAGSGPASDSGSEPDRDPEPDGDHAFRSDPDRTSRRIDDQHADLSAGRTGPAGHAATTTGHSEGVEDAGSPVGGPGGPVDEPGDSVDGPGSPAATRHTTAGGLGDIHGIGITILVADLARSVAFYRDRLGFRHVDGGEGSAILASGDTRLVLRAVPDVAPVNRRLVHINLEVDDVHAVYETLKSGGIRFTYAPRAVNRGSKLEQWAAAFRDPDGHGIALIQWRTRAATGPDNS